MPRRRHRVVARLLDPLREVEQFCLSRNCLKMTPLSTLTRWDAQLFIERFGFRSVLKRGLGDGSPPLLKGWLET